MAVTKDETRNSILGELYCIKNNFKDQNKKNDFFLFIKFKV